VVYRDGWRAVGLALISGPDVRAKAERLAEMLWHRVGSEFADRRADLVGYRSCWGAAAPEIEPNEGVFRAAVRDPERSKVERFAHTMLGLALQAPPGLGVFGGRPEVQEAYAYWPALVPRAGRALRAPRAARPQLRPPPRARRRGDALAAPRPPGEDARAGAPLPRARRARVGPGEHGRRRGGVNMLRIERQDGVTTLTLDRPEVGNALDDALVARLGEALAACAADPAVRVVVVTGAGKVFSAGADLNWMRRMRAAGAQANLDDARRTQAVFAAVAELPRPVVARVNGPARGGGVGLLAAADIVVASSEAHFAFSEVRLGIAPAMIAPFVIARVGAARARRLFCTGETFGAADALA